mmetsp:Transcript_9086/g.41114  ORF Transcript_9086/g.41114 Transcript_9086/m.41114 type:complete len:464 (-) Transcript_9086:48-1439(-)
MPPKKGSARDKEADALAVEEQRQAKRSREIFDAAVDGRQLSRVRPSSIRELVPSKLLRRSDCKDVHKRSSVKKSRYMTIFPGQLAHIKEGRIGSLAKLDTQNPVLYIEYGDLGRLKLEGTIVRSKTTRYFTLNVKSRDRLNLEDWFDSCVVFGRYAWVGTVEENPGEEPMPFPDQLAHVAAAAAANPPKDAKKDPSADDEEEDLDPAVAAVVAAARAAHKPLTEADMWNASIAAEEGAKPIVSSHVANDDDDDDDAGGDDDTAGDAGGQPRRPRRESAKAVNYAKYDEGDDDVFDDLDDDEDGDRVFRGRATATVAKAAPAGFSAHSSGLGKKEKAAPKKPRPPKKETKNEAKTDEVISIDDDDEDDDHVDDDARKDDDEGSDDEPLAARPAANKRAGGGGQSSLLGFLKPKGDGGGGDKPRPRRASAEAAKPKPVKRKHVLDSDDDDEDESEDDDDDDDDWA